MEQQIGVRRLLQRRLESLDQLVRQIADEAHRVRQAHRARRAFDEERTRRRVERREQLVGGVRAGLDERVEERRFAGVRIADERDAKRAIAFARPALRPALALDLLQAQLERLDALADHAPVELDLRFARSAARPDAALLAFEVAPAAHETRRKILQVGELDLQLALVALRALAEDLEYQQRPVRYRDAEMALQVALLRGGQRLIEEHRLRVVPEHQRLDLVGLAGADEERRIGRLAAADETLDDRIAGRLGELRQLVERRVEPGRAEIDADQDRPGTTAVCLRRDRRSRVSAARIQGLQLASGVSAVWKLTARPGTTVEIACL